MTREEIEHVANAFYNTADCARGWRREPEKLQAGFRAAAMVAISTIERLRSERLTSEFYSHVTFEAVLSGPSHTYQHVDDAYLELVGPRTLIGRPARAAFPEVTGQGFFELLDQVYRSGEQFVGEALPFQVIDHDRIEDHLIDLTYTPIFGSSTDVTGIFVSGSRLRRC